MKKVELTNTTLLAICLRGEQVTRDAATVEGRESHAAAACGIVAESNVTTRANGKFLGTDIS